MKIYIVRTYTDNEIVTTDKGKALKQFEKYRFFDIWENDVLIKSIDFEDKEKYLTCPWCDNLKDIEAAQCEECEDFERNTL